MSPRATREGVSRDGSPLKPPVAYGWYKNINDEGMKARVAYLRSLKPQPFGGQGAAASAIRIERRGSVFIAGFVPVRWGRRGA